MALMEWQLYLERGVNANMATEILLPITI